MDFEQLKKDTGTLADFDKNLQDELDQARRSLSEVSLMLEQSQAELNKLTQRNAAITGHLQQIQQQFDTVSRSDIQMTYNAALDAQQRLLVMRGQLEKLQNEQTHLEKLIAIYERVQNYMISLNLGGKGKGMKSSGNNMFEMLIDVQESERQRLSRQMHDGPAQALSNFIVQTEITSRMFDMDPTKAKEELEKLKTSSMNTFQKVRSYIDDLRPMMIDDLGLIPTLKRYLMNIKEQTGIEVGSNISGGEQKLDPFLDILIFRSVQELVGNSVKHNLENASKMKIDVSLSIDPANIKLAIKDNGKGFDTGSLKDSGGLGLKLLQERVTMLGGFLNINSSPEKGTDVNLQVPIPDQAANS